MLAMFVPLSADSRARRRPFSFHQTRVEGRWAGIMRRWRSGELSPRSRAQEQTAPPGRCKSSLRRRSFRPVAKLPGDFFGEEFGEQVVVVRFQLAQVGLGVTFGI